MSYTDDRETFEAEIFRPPHLARLLEHAGRYTRKLGKSDSNDLIKAAVDELWGLRAQIVDTNSMITAWEEALKLAAGRKDVWVTWPGGSLGERRVVWNGNLGREF